MPKATKDKKTIRIRTQGSGVIHEKGSIVFFLFGESFVFRTKKNSSGKASSAGSGFVSRVRKCQIMFFYVHGDKKITKKQDNYLVFFF